MPYHRLRALSLVISLLAFCSICSADSLPEVKSSFPDGRAVSFDGLSVTATFPGSIYVETSDRSGGIRVDTTTVFTEGDVVNVSGTIETDLATDERYVAASPEYPQATGSRLVLKPLGVVARAFTGGDFGRQTGIAGDLHLNNIGMLVTIWGPVSAFDPANPGSWFRVSESGGPEIKVVVPSV